MKLVNNERMPHVLEDGTQLSAAGTPGSTKVVEKVSDADRARLIDSGRVSVVEESRREVAAPTPTPLPSAQEPKPVKGGVK